MEKNSDKTIIVDKKKIFSDYLVDVIAPNLYHGFKRIYNEALLMEAQYIEGARLDPQIINPGVLKIFQLYVVGLDKWSDSMIETETKWIRNKSGCADIFDDLIKAVIKSHIDVLTYSSNNKANDKISKEKIHDKIEPKNFIHACYLECGKIFVHHPFLFYHDFSNSELKDNERKIYQLIKIGIKNGIIRILPMRKILTEYLSEEIFPEESEKYLKIKDMLYENQKKQEQNEKHDEGGRMKLIESSDSSMTNHFAELENELNDPFIYPYDNSNNLNNPNNPNNFNDLEGLIYGFKPEDTIDVEILNPNSQKNNEVNEVNEENKVEDLNENIIEVNKNSNQKQQSPQQLSPKTNVEKSHDNSKEIQKDIQKESEKAQDYEDIQEIFGKVTKKGKNNSKSILSEAFNVVKDTNQSVANNVNDINNVINNVDEDIKIVKKSPADNDNFFNEMGNV